MAKSSAAPATPQDSTLRGWPESYEFSAKVSQSAEILTKHIAETAIGLAIVRHGLEAADAEETNEAEIVSDVTACLLGEETGCNDPDDLDDTNCEVLFAEKELREQFDILPLLRRIAAHQALYEALSAVIAVGAIMPDDTPEKPSVIFGHPSSKQWADIFLKARAALALADAAQGEK